jgi:epoxyqueuosine reductase QueG
MSVETRILELIPKTDDYISGFADLRGLLHPKFSDYPSAVVIGKKLDDRIIDDLNPNGPTPEYYSLYCQTNDLLDNLISRISQTLNSLSIKNLPMVASGSRDAVYYLQDYPSTLRMGFSHKMAATRAGLGWIGKTDLFISKVFGPRVRLATVLVGQSLKTSLPPVEESSCGECRACVNACPAKAANGKLWNIRTDRDEFYDVFKCRDKAQALSQKNLNLDARVCGICVSVCPAGKRTKA